VVNYIWLGMIIFSIVVAGINGNIEAITKAALEGAGEGVKTSLHLISIIAFWLGLMRIAEAAGLIQILARIVRPLTRILFPEPPQGSPGAWGNNHEPERQTYSVWATQPHQWV